MDFQVRTDLMTIRELLNITQKELGKELGIEPITILRTEKGETSFSPVNRERFYDFVFNRGISLNKIKEMLYREEMSSDSILLFHGAKKELDGGIKANMGRSNNDFGSGFYCGETNGQAIMFIANYKDSSMYVINFMPKGLVSKKFCVDQEWMLTIAFFRGHLEKYKNHPLIQKIAHSLTDIDYVIAPIADNRMFQIINSFIEGEITDEQCKHCLAATNLGYQYVFLSEKAISQLSILERCYLSKSEKNKQLRIKSDDTKTGEDKVKFARIEYRGKGQYIDEILK